jgi:hypothetical protein
MPAKKKQGKTPSSRRAKGLRTRVTLQVDRTLKRRWQAELETLERARRTGASAFDDLWESVAAIVEHDPPLYLAAGIATTKAFLERHVGESERTARRMMRIAKYASPAEENRYGTSKLDAILDYVEAKTGGPLKTRLPIDLGAIRLPVRRRGKPARLGLDDLTVAEITAETRKLLRSSDSPRGKPSPVVRAVTTRLRGKKLGQVTVRIRGDKLYLGAIPLDALDELLRALRGVKLPSQASVRVAVRRE